MSRMTNDIENISTTISQSLPSLFSGVLTIAGTAAVMAWYCWQLALLSCATVILTLTATKILSGKVQKFSRRRQMYLGQLNGTVEEMVSGYRTVVAYNHQDITTENFCRASDQLTRAGIRTDIFSGVMGPVMNCIGNIGFVIIAAFGGYFSINGMISVGVISAFIVYAKQFSRPINEIAQIYGQLQTAIAGAERVFMVLDEENEEKGGKSLAVGRDAGVLKGLPQGYDTMLTGSGENLSQGQRQLLAIARAFVADPKILILDEATSNVDTRTEKEIQDAMSRIMENRTSIVIAHRLSTIRDSDLIVVMDRGRIVEMGNHEELLEAMGKYYDLYMTQYAGFAT
ncbi:MAG: ABC transporter ATP-binding protein [Hungatella sp.]|nr:ABC transporter ATP-binding protein [Hungatella sp.]